MPSVEVAVAVGAMHLPAGAAAAVCIIMITAGPAPALQAKVTVEASMAGACTMASHSQDPGVVVQALAARAQAAALAVALAVQEPLAQFLLEKPFLLVAAAGERRCEAMLQPAPLRQTASAVKGAQVEGATVAWRSSSTRLVRMGDQAQAAAAAEAPKAEKDLQQRAATSLEAAGAVAS